MTNWYVWIPSVIAVGALGLHWYLIRQTLIDFKKSSNERIGKLESRIEKVEKDYVSKETHALICGKSGLEIQQIFIKCLDRTKDDIFKHLRRHLDEIDKRFEKIAKK